MDYLNWNALAQVDMLALRNKRPYPWLNPAGWLTDKGYQALLASLPSIDQFRQVFGKKRKHGQKPHDRYALEYRPGLALSTHWQAFIDELNGRRYRQFMAQAVGHDAFRLRFHWHYTPAACSVSPHCDAWRKLGSHIFYLNPEGEWQPEWGGNTLILDDHGRFSSSSAPGFDAFEQVAASVSVGNRSLLFMRRGNSWHGVQAISCPEGYFRKVFIVVIDRNRWFDRVMDWCGIGTPGY